MNEFIILLIFIAIGYASGVVIGMLGIGGGLIFVPVLYYMLPIAGIPETQLIYSAIATSLMAGAIASSSSGLLHLKHKNVLFSRALLLASGSVITAFLIPYFVVKTHSRTLEIIFAVVFVLVALRMLFDRNETDKPRKISLNNFYLILTGIFVGSISAFTGLGGGVIYVPVLIYLFSVKIKNAVGTSAVATALTMISSSISYFILGNNPAFSGAASSYIVFSAAVPLGIGAVAGTFTGVKFSLIFHSGTIRKVFSVILIIAVLRILINL